MFQKRLSNRSAQSTLEFVVIITLILLTFLLFQNFIVRAFSGRWRFVGDSVGLGKQYDPRPFGVDGTGGGTQECFFDVFANHWVDTRCFKENCDCTLPTEDPAYNARCVICRDVTCNDAICNDED